MTKMNIFLFGETLINGFLLVFFPLDRSLFLAIIEHIFLRSDTPRTPSHRGREHLNGHFSRGLIIGEEARSGLLKPSRI